MFLGKMGHIFSDLAGNKAEIIRFVKVKAKQVVTTTPNHNDNGEVKVAQKKNSILPDTSTNQYNWIMAGTLVLLIGVLMYLIALKRRAY
ncbi:LPXTG cell wall anchor domain-containing protein [Neobacillus sp. K501]